MTPEERRAYNANYYQNVIKPLRSTVRGFNERYTGVPAARQFIVDKQAAAIRRGGIYFYSPEAFVQTRNDFEANSLGEDGIAEDANANYYTLQAQGWSRHQIFTGFPNICKAITGYYPEERSANVV